MQNLWIVFTTGLLTGGISCAAVQGGLLATAIAGVQAKNKDDKNIGVKALAAFLSAKLVSHLVWGGILGGLGAVVMPSIFFRGSVIMVMSVYMTGVGLAMWDAHPFFRRFLIRTPRFMGKIIRNTAKSGQLFAPFVLGLMTILIPCGITQAMMAESLASGSAVNGALILGVFVLGTTPTFALIGLAMSKIGSAAQNYLQKAAASVVIVMALITFNSGLVLAGSPVSANTIAREVYCVLSYCKNNSEIADNSSDTVGIEINSRGYKTDQSAITAGHTIQLNLVNTDGVGCQQEFTIPSLNISQLVPPGSKRQLEFVAPANPGVLAYSCGMGMYSGQFKVVD